MTYGVLFVVTGQLLMFGSLIAWLTLHQMRRRADEANEAAGPSDEPPAVVQPLADRLHHAPARTFGWHLLALGVLGVVFMLLPATFMALQVQPTTWQLGLACFLLLLAVTWIAIEVSRGHLAADVRERRRARRELAAASRRELEQEVASYRERSEQERSDRDRTQREW